MKKILLVSICAAILTSTQALAGTGLDRLTSFSKSLKTLEASFEQTSYDENMKATEKSSGQVYMQKPGKFRWNYQEPYAQEIISDGDKLYIYEEDLEQVSIRKFDEALGTAPISLLTDIKDLKEQFTIKELGEVDGLYVLQLEAKVKDTDYHFFLLALGEAGLEKMQLKDKLGQQTDIELSNVKLNKKLNNSLFTFTPPKGVDVIDSTK